MPVKRRSEKRRMSPDAEAAIWKSYFEAGHDFFDELPSIGVAVDDRQHPPRDVSAEAWARLGYLCPGAPWATEQFGEPTCR